MYAIAYGASHGVLHAKVLPHDYGRTFSLSSLSAPTQQCMRHYLFL
jgi:hypothetical protein